MDLSGNKIQLLSFNKDIIRIYNFTNNKQYYIKINHAYDLSLGKIYPDQANYTYIIGRNLYICDHYLYFCKWVIPAGAYSLITFKKNVKEINWNGDFTLKEMYDYWLKEEITINKIKEVLNLPILDTRWLIKRWQQEKILKSGGKVYE